VSLKSKNTQLSKQKQLAQIKRQFTEVVRHEGLDEFNSEEQILPQQQRASRTKRNQNRTEDADRNIFMTDGAEK
jgi:hypothetical protein